MKSVSFMKLILSYHMLTIYICRIYFILDALKLAIQMGHCIGRLIMFEVLNIIRLLNNVKIHKYVPQQILRDEKQLRCPSKSNLDIPKVAESFKLSEHPQCFQNLNYQTTLYLTEFELQILKYGNGRSMGCWSSRAEMTKSEDVVAVLGSDESLNRAPPFRQYLNRRPSKITSKLMLMRKNAPLKK